MKTNLSTSPGNRFQYRDYWIEIFLDDDGEYEPNIECPNQGGVVWLEGEYKRQDAINKAKQWIDERY